MGSANKDIDSCQVGLLYELNFIQIRRSQVQELSLNDQKKYIKWEHTAMPSLKDQSILTTPSLSENPPHSFATVARAVCSGQEADYRFLLVATKTPAL